MFILQCTGVVVGLRLQKIQKPRLVSQSRGFVSCFLFFPYGAGVGLGSMPS